MDMLKAEWRRYRLNFNFEARTSRAVMHFKDTYFVRVFDDVVPQRFAIGECGLFAGLSAEDDPDFERRLDAVCANPSAEALAAADSCVRFGFESALAALDGEEVSEDFASQGVEINGLVWMGDKRLMFKRLGAKLDEGFRCMKLKIGGIDFADELDLLAYIRKHFPATDLELRVDANGAFTADNVYEKLLALERYSIHSIEQPVKAGQPELMADVCRRSAIPVALDEELIGNTTLAHKEQLLSDISPAYIILKPTLCGGFRAADQWISVAEKRKIGWWATSALESNVGLAAIARWLSKYKITMPQGLGTGELFTNNIGTGVSRCGSRVYVSAHTDFSDVNKLFENELPH